MHHMLGYAYKHELPEKFYFISYNIIRDGDNDWIEIWVKKDDGSTRLYLVEYSDALREQLAAAEKRRRKTGRQQRGYRDRNTGDIVIKNFSVHDILKKE